MIKCGHVCGLRLPCRSSIEALLVSRYYLSTISSKFVYFLIYLSLFVTEYCLSCKRIYFEIHPVSYSDTISPNFHGGNV